MADPWLLTLRSGRLTLRALRLQKETSMADQTIPSLFESCAAAFAENVLVWEKRGPRYEATSYRDMRALVRRFAAGLMSLGLGKGDRVALISEGRKDWVMSELGILYSGAVNVPVSVKVEELSDLKFRLAHSGCRMAIVSKSQASKMRAIKGDLPDLERTIVLDELADFERDELFAGDVLKKGDALLEDRGGEFEAVWRSVRRDDPANICYTSGTTADPKGIVLTHGNYTANVEQSLALCPVREDSVTLAILPWDHAFAHTVCIYAFIRNGSAFASVELGRTPMETLKNIPKNIKEIRPTVLMSVPALAKSFRKSIEKGVRDKGPKAEALFRSALRAAYRYNGEGWNRGRGWRKLTKPLLFAYDRLLFLKIRENFGGRLEFFIGGGALLDIELQRFFYAIGIPMFQGYGLTEAAPVISANSPRAHKLGSSGRVVPNLEIRIADEAGNPLLPGAKGEIVVRGENVMAGYWKNEKATREALRDGWLYTGDIGYLDADGYLYVLGRVKSLLIASDGEKYSPEVIEEAVTDHSPFIEQFLLYNNQSPYTVALLVPNREAVLRQLEDKGLSTGTPVGQEAALRLLEAEVGQFREGGRYAGEFPSRWLPSAVAVLGEGFTEQNGLLNSTLKMVRGKIADFYANRLDVLFTPEGRDICHAQNRAIVERWE
jgi:long-chain acyl-CoA synthetase